MTEMNRYSSIKSGFCPECGSDNIYTATGKYNNKVVLFDTAGLDIYVCGTCGYLAEFIQMGRHLDHVKEKWEPLNKRKNDEVRG